MLVQRQSNNVMGISKIASHIECYFFSTKFNGIKKLDRSCTFFPVNSCDR